MSDLPPICHVVAGPNGSGKSTFALRYLPHARRDYAKRRDQTGRRKCANLLAQFRAAGRTPPPDLWERLAADRRAQLENELRWIEMARAEAESAFSASPASTASTVSTVSTPMP